MQGFGILRPEEIKCPCDSVFMRTHAHAHTSHRAGFRPYSVQHTVILYLLTFPALKRMLAHRQFGFITYIPARSSVMKISSLKAIYLGTQGERKAWLLAENTQQSQGRELSCRHLESWDLGYPSLDVLEPSPADHGSGCPTCSPRTIPPASLESGVEPGVLGGNVCYLGRGLELSS